MKLSSGESSIVDERNVLEYVLATSNAIERLEAWRLNASIGDGSLS